MTVIAGSFFTSPRNSRMRKLKTQAKNWKLKHYRGEKNLKISIRLLKNSSFWLTFLIFSTLPKTGRKKAWVSVKWICWYRMNGWQNKMIWPNNHYLVVTENCRTFFLQRQQIDTCPEFSSIKEETPWAITLFASVLRTRAVHLSKKPLLLLQ